MYPSPLMTETLAKVSGIAKMNLNLMTNNELEQLISDLTHLLIANFPDNEVKKETRISFAATMLSRASININFNYTDIYIARKELFKLKEKYLNSHKKKRNGIKNDSFISILDELIYSNRLNVDSIDLYKSALSRDFKDYDDLTCIIDSIEFLRKSIENIENQKEKINRKAYNLLYKAVKENHQKVRLWVRLIKFCYQQSYNKYIEIWNLIGDLEYAKISHKLSASFLYSMYLSLIIECAWASIRCHFDKSSTTEQKINSKQFLNFIISERFVSTIFNESDFIAQGYYKSIYSQLKVLLGTISFIIQENSPEYFNKYDLLDWNSQYKEWILKEENNEINVWLYWILSNTHLNSQTKPFEFWIKLLSKADFSEQHSLKAILLPFPDYKVLSKIGSEEVFKDILPTLLVENHYQGWFYDLIKSTENTEILAVEVFEQNDFYKSINSIIKNGASNKISLFDFIQKCNTVSESFNPILYEWTSLFIAKKIVEAIQKEVTEDHNVLKRIERRKVNLHPANFLLDKTLFDKQVLNWATFKQKINDLNVTLIPYENQIEDERYTINKLENIYRSEIALINGLGVLIFQILCKNVNFPWIWNLCDSNQILSNIIINTALRRSLSSYSQGILQSCLSLKNRESIWLKQQSKEIFDDEFSPFMVNNLNSLVNVLQKAINKLEESQISVQSDYRRQLIPISLKSYTQSNNPFKTV